MDSRLQLVKICLGPSKSHWSSERLCIFWNFTCQNVVIYLSSCWKFDLHYSMDDKKWMCECLGQYAESDWRIDQSSSKKAQWKYHKKLVIHAILMHRSNCGNVALKSNMAALTSMTFESPFTFIIQSGRKGWNSIEWLTNYYFKVRHCILRSSSTKYADRHPVSYLRRVVRCLSPMTQQ